MRLRDLVREGRPAFPPSWQDPHTGLEPLRHEPLGGILVEVEWGRQNLSLELTNYWRGRRLEDGSSPTTRRSCRESTRC